MTTIALDNAMMQAASIEQAVLFSALFYPVDTIPALRSFQLQPGDMLHEGRGQMLATIYRIADERGAQAVSPLSVQVALREQGLAQYAAELLIEADSAGMAVEPAALEGPVRWLRNVAAAQRAIEAGGRITAAAMEGKLDRVVELAERVRRDAAGQPEYVRAPFPQIVSARDLLREALPPIRWIVDDILPEGACLLAGPPKVKKSWLALSLAVAVAAGGHALGHYDAAQGKALYLDLEGSLRRMQSRLLAMTPDGDVPADLHIASSWPNGEEGLQLLDAWLEANDDARLVVIDVLARFRGARDPRVDLYEHDYAFLQRINAVAERHGVAIVVIHHTRKMRAENVFHEVSGSTGLTGGVATTWVLRQMAEHPDQQILAIQGRDVMLDDPIAIRWDAYLCQHVVAEVGPHVSSGSARRAVYDVIATAGECTIKDIVAATGTSAKAVDNHLRRLIEDGAVRRVGRGRYATLQRGGVAAPVRREPPRGAAFTPPEPEPEPTPTPEPEPTPTPEPEPERAGAGPAYAHVPLSDQERRLIARHRREAEARARAHIPADAERLEIDGVIVVSDGGGWRRIYADGSLGERYMTPQAAARDSMGRGGNER